MEVFQCMKQLDDTIRYKQHNHKPDTFQLYIGMAIIVLSDQSTWRVDHDLLTLRFIL